MRRQLALAAVQLSQDRDFDGVCALIAGDLGVPTEDLFLQAFDDHEVGYVVTCLLRTLENEPAQGRTTLLRPSWRFLDTHLSATYRALALDESSQTFEKQRKLRRVLPQLEETLKGIEAALHIESIGRSRQETLRTVNQDVIKPMASLLFEPVLPTVHRSLDLAAAYLSSDSRGRLGPHKEASRLQVELDRLLDRCVDPVQRALWHIGATAIAEILRHFSESPAAQPADLMVELPEKRYPLHQPGQAMDLQLRLVNRGPGVAYDVNVVVDDDTGNVDVLDRDLRLEDLSEGALQFQLPCLVLEAEDVFLLHGTARWTDLAGDLFENAFELEVQSQPANVPWDALQRSDPYSLEPVVGEGNLVGRSDVLNALRQRLFSSSIGSFWLWGQRRVGKTSVAKTLVAELAASADPKILPLYLEAGDFVEPDAVGTVARLGRIIADEICRSDERFANLPKPAFSRSLSPLGDLLRDVQRIDANFRVVIVIDEFDRLPPELYERGALSQTFFVTLRTLSGKPNVGFVLVGGEAMDLIMALQGQELNKFQVVRLDYFDREFQFADFASLVREPVAPWVNIHDSAIAALYDLTSGNPYYAKLVGQELFALVLRRRDLAVTPVEVREAAALTIKAVGSSSFQHFWDDRLPPKNTEGTSIRRRHALVAMAQCMSAEGGEVRFDRVADAASRLGLSETDLMSTIEEFQSRRILEADDELIRATIDLFGMWLSAKGVQELLVGLPELSRAQQEALEAAPLAILPHEIVELVEGWPSYQGRPITSENVRAWLDQFGTVREQRLMFKLLRHLRIYSAGLVRERLDDAHGIVRRGLKHVIEEGRRKRSDIFVTYLGATGKSSLKIARHYADTARIYTENVVTLEQLTSRIGSSKAGSVSAVVILDDFVGTGRTLCRQLVDEQARLRALAAEERTIYLLTLCATQSGIEAVDKAIRDLRLPLVFHAIDVLGDEARCLSPEAGIFSDDAERREAKEVLEYWGNRLVDRNPLGYGDGQLLVVFEDTVPNNTIPVLWQVTQSWRPLFKRPK